MKLKILLTILLIPSFLFAQSGDNADRSYLEDFANVKAVLAYKPQNSQKKVFYELSDIESRDAKPSYILALRANKAEQLIITDANKDMFFYYESAPALVENYKEALVAGDRDGAIGLMRKDIYSLLPLMGAREDLFTIQEPILEYLNLLITTKRTNELYSLFEMAKEKDLIDNYTAIFMPLSKQLAEKKEFDKAANVINSLNLDLNDADLTIDLMGILTLFRESKKISEVARYYQRLQIVPNSRFALEAKMWGLYCDIQTGNLLTAKVLLESFSNVDKNLPEYSLYKFILGLVEYDSNKHLLALEAFSEGIVYGKSTDDWMPELMYYTALCYLKAEQKDVSIQILEEMRKFYPDNVFLAQAEKDLK